MLRQTDFSVLLREPRRFAQAGFPTKFCESLAAGTPVIANLTSDLGMYLTDGVEGLVVDDHSTSALVTTLRRAVALTLDERQVMREAARRRAQQSFDFRTSTQQMATFLEDLHRMRNGFRSSIDITERICQNH